MRKIWLAGVALAILAPAPGQSREMTADTSVRPIAITRPPDGEARMRQARPYHFRKVQPLLVPAAPRCDFACWFFNRRMRAITRRRPRSRLRTRPYRLSLRSPGECWCGPTSPLAGEVDARARRESVG